MKPQKGPSLGLLVSVPSPDEIQGCVRKDAVLNQDESSATSLHTFQDVLSGGQVEKVQPRSNLMLSLKL